MCAADRALCAMCGYLPRPRRKSTGEKKDAVKKNWPGSAAAVAPDPYAVPRAMWDVAAAAEPVATAIAMPPGAVPEPSSRLSPGLSTFRSLFQQYEQGGV